jgi:amino acid adenylation domain-containing protein
MNKKNIETIYTLSPAQQGMLYETLSAPTSGIHVEQLLCTLQGELDVHAFEHAWQWAMNRHAILRTGFVWENITEPLQVVFRQIRVPLEHFDWSALSTQAQQTQIEDYLKEDRQRCFKFAQAPIMRLALFKLSFNTYYFLWTIHHILMDGWCNALVINEVLSCYQALSNKQAFSLKPSRPYKDYITWLKRQDQSKAEQYWRKTLQGFHAVTPLGRVDEQLELPLEDERYGTQEFTLPPPVVVDFRSVLRKHRLTINTLFQGTWALLLSRYSRTNDVVFGITVSGRPPELDGIDTMVGMCINTLPIRIRLDPTMSLWSWLATIQEQNLELRQFEYSSAGLVQSCSELPHALSLFGSLLVVENYPGRQADTQLNISITHIRPKGAQTKYPLTFLATLGDTLGVKCIYDTERIGSSSITYILEDFRMILNRIAQATTVSLGGLQQLVPLQHIPVVRPARHHQQAERSHTHRALRNPFEATIAEIWCDLLGTLQVDIHDNFFVQGGHSLLATQLLSRVGTVLGVEIPLRGLFEAPTIAGLAQLVEHKLRSEQVGSLPPLLPASQSQDFPLSFAQQRLWFLDQLEPDSPAYLMSNSFRIRGILHITALRKGIAELVRRHESLRTTFLLKDNQPIQYIHPATNTYHFPIVDLSGVGKTKREGEARRLAYQEALKPCNLAQGPLVRMTLLRLADEDHVLLITMHHIISDGWSGNIFLEELATLYHAFVEGQPSPLELLPIQYKDYAVWQRQWLQGQALENQLIYWVQRLQGTPALDLPTDYPRPPVRTYRGDTASLLLPLSLREQFMALSQRHGVTLFMALLAAFQVLLMRYTGQTDIAVGTPIANRTHTDLERLIGFFANTLVLRTDLSGNPTFLEVLARVREVALGAYMHQDVPFDKLVEILQPERDLSRSPLFQVEFLLQMASEISSEADDLVISHLGVEQPTAPFDLVLVAFDTPEGLRCDVQYATDLFTAKSIRQLLHRWQILLESIVTKPHARLSDLSLLSESERHLILHDWLPEHCEPSLNRSFHELFAVQVAITPDAIALVTEQTLLSYAELNRRANQFAHYLQALGVQFEVLVGVALERSAAWLISVLAILKAGGTYLPLDPSYPIERLTFMLEDAQVPLLLIERTELEMLSDTRTHLLRLQEVWPLIEQQPSDPPSSRVQMEQVAYVIYTSGSTGTPKGVQVPHRGLSNLAAVQAQTFGVNAQSHVLQFASQSFDASISEIVTTLLTGACLYLAPAEHRLPGPELLALLQRWAITVVTLPPSTLAALPIQPLPALQTLVVAGEACPAELVTRWAAGRRFYNAYGPTEATVCASIAHCEATSGDRPGIGRAIANTQLYVLDDQLHLTPPGIAGELYIGGLGIARGYLDRAALTAERFVPHSFSDQIGARLYRTGDRVRQRDDGSLDFLGRLDEQVKIRGYRIELGEIETILTRHSAIQMAVMLVQQDTIEDPRLIAYVAKTSPEVELSSMEARAYLQDLLPDYMLPARIFVLDTLPLLPNGKIDRRKLRTLEIGERTTDATSSQERTPNEQAITEIWCEVLNDEQIGLHDNFFDLGGHSLLATQLMARVNALFGMDMPVRLLFEAPTIAELAQRAEQTLHGTQPIKDFPLLPASRDQDVPLSFAQQRLWLLDQLEPGSTAYLIPTAWRVQGDLKRDILFQSLAALVQRHESLRTTFEVKDGQPVQIIHPFDKLRLPLVDLRAVVCEQRERVARHLAQQEAQHPCDLGRGPLLRLSLLWLDAQDYVLLLTAHHIISDGWSHDIFVHELLLLYRAFGAGESSPLVPLPIQYADFAFWQRQWLQGSILQQQLDYWLRQLAHAPVLALPTDYPRPPIKTFHGAAISLLIAPPLRDALIALSQHEHVTLFMTLLASFQILLARYSGQEDISVGTPIANRRHKELEGLIGFFVNILVLRTDLAGNPSFLTVLHRVRELSIDAYAHQDVPFERLVELLQPERDLSRSPLFQVMFSLQNISDPVAEPNGLDLRRLEIEMNTARFDLTLSLVDTPSGIHGALSYNTDLFRASTMKRFLQSWQNLLAAFVAHPEQRLSEVSLLTTTERQRMVVEWNATAVELLGSPCFHQLFEQQAHRRSDTVALIYQEHALTYAELNRRANQLAHYLQAQGIQLGAMVGLCMSRSLQMIVGLLAILKAGGAYVPLDPESPASRITYQLHDIQTPLLLTEQALLLRLPAWTGNVLCLDEPLVVTQLSQQPSSNPKQVLDPQHLAYVIYTSGSTGTPKGVMISHHSVTNYTQAICTLIANQPGLHFAMVSTLAADLGNTAIFSALSSGGCLHVLPSEVVLSPGAFVQTVTQHPIDVLKIVPSHLSVLLSSNEQGGTVLSRRSLVLGGEAFPNTLLNRLQDLPSDCQIFNHYGPTETTIGVLVHQVDPQKDAQQTAPAETTVPLGRPIANTEAYILDHWQQCVPVGVIGELYLAGAGLAQGYLHQPEQTAGCFVPHPFSSCPGARMYRTGDLAYYTEEGTIMFVGRRDSQVKVRGYRIELDEIEAVLRQHPDVRDAVVLLRKDGSAEPRLTGYVVPHGQPAPTTEELRTFVRQRIPDYMVPPIFMVLESFLLTANGKVDRRQLPEPVLLHSVSPTTQRELRPVEEILLDIWKDMLALPCLGIEDNFFLCGGHSLLVMRTIARIRSVLQVELPLRILFEAPTIATLAPQVEQRLRGEPSIEIPAPAPVSRTQDLPLSFAQQRLWFLDQLVPNSPAYLIPRALHLHGTLHISTLQDSLDALVLRHESLRTTFSTRDGQPTQVIHPIRQQHLPLIDLRGLQWERRMSEARRLTREETLSPCDLSQGPLLRTRLLRIELEDHVFLLTMHHIISDGWSSRIFLSELAMLYKAFRDGQASPLPPLAIQYGDFAVWQRQWLQGPILEKQLSYWTRQLAGASALDLPTDYPRPPVQSYRGAQQSFILEAQLVDKLLELSHREGVTLFMTLLAAFQVLLYRYSGQTDIVVGTDIANRTHVETESLIGFFVNLLALRTNLGGVPTFRTVLHRVREVVLGAYIHQDIPFEMLVDKLLPQRSQDRMPLAQVLFVMQNLPQIRDELADLTLDSFNGETSVAKFDLALFLFEGPTADLHGLANYSIDLFEKRTIVRMLQRFETLLQGVVASPDTPINAIDLMATSERVRETNRISSLQKKLLSTKGKTIELS